tara:strand:- start:83 stop:682 length:600 start_codon:yes stop_codon:yes gene_type:complete
MQIFVAPYSNPLAGEWTDAEDAEETFAAFRGPTAADQARRFLAEKHGEHLTVERVSDDAALTAAARYGETFHDVEGPEVAVMDSDCRIINEWTSPDAIVALAEGLEESHLSEFAFGVYCDYIAPDMGDADDVRSAIEEAEECYVGQFDSDEDMAREQVDSCGLLEEMPESLRFYFDYASFARDLMMDHFADGTHYFRSC